VVLVLSQAGRAQVAVCGNGVLEPPELCDDGNTVSGDCCSATCVPEPDLPPDCSAAVASVEQVWPPNHKAVPIALGGIVDPDGDPVVVTVTAIAQDEPLDATGDGATCPDATGVGLDGVSVRAERSGNGDGRVYHVAFQAADRCNAVCVGEVTVCVPHDHRPGATCGDGGPLYDSTLGAPPCVGDACGPADCVPDPGDVDECHDDDVPASITVRLDRARKLLGRGGGRGKSAGVGRRAAKQIAKAAKRVGRALEAGDLSPGCASTLSAFLAGAGPCVACSGE
jgi:cysteine-rich repeat protein